MGEKVKHLRTQRRSASASDWRRATARCDRPERAELVLPVLAQILGVSYERTDD